MLMLGSENNMHVVLVQVTTPSVLATARPLKGRNKVMESNVIQGQAKTAHDLAQHHHTPHCMQPIQCTRNPLILLWMEFH
jgi:hypothetical protein